MVEREINEEEVIKAQAKKSSYQLNIILIRDQKQDNGM